MTGGIIQLVAYGKEDLFLTRDPQITFFKIIYRRHTNFAKEHITQFFTNNPDFGKNTTCSISTQGDLINNMALKLTLPEIPKFVSSPFGPQTEFAWIRNIGHAMIKTIDIEINGQIIDRHYGEWLHIWSSLTTRNIDDKGIDKIIGNIPELTEFSNGKESYTLFIPLYFWFCRSPGLSIPLISLQYSDIKVNIDLYELERCYRITPTQYIKVDANLVNFEKYEFLEQFGSDGVCRFGMFSHFDIINKRLYYSNITCEKFVGVPSESVIDILTEKERKNILCLPNSLKYSIKGVSSGESVMPEINVKSVSFNRRPLKNICLNECVLLIDYIYLDDEERYKFAQTKHDYLIEQLYYTPNTSIDSVNRKIKLDIDQPCKFMVWLTQLDYIAKYNDRFNYTDTHIRKRKYDVENFDPTKIKIYDNTKLDEVVGNSLIKEDTIKLNSQERLTQRKDFSLFPKDITPSGTTNMSQIELIELLMKFNNIISVNKTAKFRAYSLCYNILRVDNGLSATIFIQ
jgi:hypothetical protein